MLFRSRYTVASLLSGGNRQVRPHRANRGHFPLWQPIATRSLASASIRGRKLQPSWVEPSARSSVGKRNEGFPYIAYREAGAEVSSLTIPSWRTGSRDEARNWTPTILPERVSQPLLRPEASRHAKSLLANRNFTAARIAAWLVPLLLVGALTVAFSAGHRVARFKALASGHTPNAAAQDLYLKGRYYWDRRTPEDLNKAIDYFTQAIVKDPSDAQAYVGLADCYNLLREFGAMSPVEAYPARVVGGSARCGTQ